MKINRYAFVLCLMVCVVIGGELTMAKQVEKATFAGGCFWCMQPPYDDLPGVLETVVGYTGGHVVSPSYELVSTGKTGHVEAVQIFFDPSRTSYATLLAVFWKNINPSQADGQFADIGSHYETVVFYHSEAQKKEALASKRALELSGKFPRVATRIVAAAAFYPAESAHQEFYKKSPLRYKSYKVGSGRQRFIEKTWSER
jgi:methionine-S-sulfoxide reductase